MQGNQRLRERNKDGTYSLFEVIIHTEFGLPVIFSPRMWERLFGKLQRYAGWHVTDADNAEGVLKHQNRQNTISVTTKPNEKLIGGLLTTGGVGFYIEGSRVFSSPHDFFSHRSPDGRKLRRRDNPESFLRQLGPAWYAIIQDGVEQFRALKPKEQWDARTLAEIDAVLEAIHTKKDQYINRLDFAPTIRYPDPRGFDLANPLYTYLESFFRTESDITPAQGHKLTPAQDKAHRRIKHQIVQRYLIEQERVLQNTLKDFRSIGDPRAGWDETLLTKYSVTAAYIYTSPEGDLIYHPSGQLTKAVKELFAVLKKYEVPFDVEVADAGTDTIIKYMGSKPLGVLDERRKRIPTMKSIEEKIDSLIAKGYSDEQITEALTRLKEHDLDGVAAEFGAGLRSALDSGGPYYAAMEVINVVASALEEYTPKPSYETSDEVEDTQWEFYSVLSEELQKLATAAY